MITRESPVSSGSFIKPSQIRLKTEFIGQRFHDIQFTNSLFYSDVRDLKDNKPSLKIRLVDTAGEEEIVILRQGCPGLP